VGNTPPVQLGTIKLVNPAIGDLRKGADGLMRMAGGDDAPADPTVRVADGAVEGSNVNPVDSMVGLIAAARRHLQVHTCQPLRFSQPCGNGLTFLRDVRQLGASASRQKPLHPSQLRRLLQHWPAGGTVGWEVLLLVGQRLTP
jgi:hypothetical protein